MAMIMKQVEQEKLSKEEAEEPQATTAAISMFPGLVVVQPDRMRRVHSMSRLTSGSR